MSTLQQRCNHAWRVVATGMSFGVFGIGGLLLSLTLFPLLRLIAPAAVDTRHQAQRVVHLTWRSFVWFMKIAGILTWEVRGAERLAPPGRLIVANHPSLLDVVFMIALMPRVDCIVKPAVLRNPFMRGPATAAGYIPNADPERLVEDCARTLLRGNSLLMFPEGTRTQPGLPIRMKRGAAQIALAAGCETLPVTITVTPTTLTKHEPWYRVPPRPFHVTIAVGEPLPAARFLEGGISRAAAARHMTEYLENYFTQATAAQAAAPRSCGTPGAVAPV